MTTYLLNLPSLDIGTYEKTNAAQQKEDIWIFAFLFAGRVSFFTSGSENVHYVEKLESGVRYAITISFTCDPHMAISDPDAK